MLFWIKWSIFTHEKALYVERSILLGLAFSVFFFRNVKNSLKFELIKTIFSAFSEMFFIHFAH